jgi:hypothetical protein
MLTLREGLRVVGELRHYLVRVEVQLLLRGARLRQERQQQRSAQREALR